MSKSTSRPTLPGDPLTPEVTPPEVTPPEPTPPEPTPPEPTPPEVTPPEPTPTAQIIEEIKAQTTTQLNQLKQQYEKLLSERDEIIRAYINNDSQPTQTKMTVAERINANRIIKKW